MCELNQNEINEVSGGRFMKLAAIIKEAKDFAEGFIEGVKKGYNA